LEENKIKEVEFNKRDFGHMLVAGLLAVIIYSSVIVYYLDYIVAIMNSNDIIALLLLFGIVASLFCVWKIAAVLTGVIILKRKASYQYVMVAKDN